jgi:hypothetical protein
VTPGPSIEALARDLPFIITESRIDSARPAEVTRQPRLSLALGFAMFAATDRQNARVQVTDDFGTLYAQFGMLWAVPEGHQ